MYDCDVQDGRIYMAMELIRGSSITDYAKVNNLRIRDRLELMARVADAVQYLHSRGVIHRNLKPRSIMAENTGGQPKIVSFSLTRPIGPAPEESGNLFGTL